MAEPSWAMVTQRVSDDVALRTSAERFAKAFRLSPVAIGIVALKESRIVDVNDAALALAGRTRDEMIGHTTIEIGLWLDPAHRQEMYAQLVVHRAIHDIPVQLTRKNGEIRTARMSVELIEVAGEMCMLAVISDVTEKHETERMLDEAQSIGHVGSWMIDLSTRAIRWSDEARRIIGAAGEPPTYEQYMACVHPEDAPRLRDAFMRSIREGVGSQLDFCRARPRRHVLQQRPARVRDRGEPFRHNLHNLCGSLELRGASQHV